MNKYNEIMADLEEKIRSGRYRPGGRLPSLRDLTGLYRCSLSTAVRVYQELEKRHVIYSIPQSGYYLVEKMKERPARADNETIDFTSPSPDPDVFPYLDFQHCLNKAIDIFKDQLFTYGGSQGLESLRHALVSHLASDQVFAQVKRLVITSGVQQALMILTRMPFPGKGDTILVEQPSYDLYLRLLELEGVPVGTVHRSAEGLDLDQLEERFKRGGIKFFYTMTRYHNPLGTSLLAEERRAVAELAGKYGVYIVEDDYMSDLGLERRADPIHAYDSSAHVIYLKSFSKIIFPGLRVGAAVLPERLLPAFQTYKRLADLNTSFLSQAALEIYIKNGMYQRHRHKISSMYTERMHALHQALKEADRDGRIEASNRSPGLGVYTQFKLSPKVNLDRLVKRLASRNIRVLGGQAFYLADYAVKDKFLRMSISRARPEQIRIGIEALLEELKKLRLG